MDKHSQVLVAAQLCRLKSLPASYLILDRRSITSLQVVTMMFSS